MIARFVVYVVLFVNTILCIPVVCGVCSTFSFVDFFMSAIIFKLFLTFTFSFWHNYPMYIIHYTEPAVCMELDSSFGRPKQFKSEVLFEVLKNY